MHNVHAIAPATEPDPIPLTAASVPARKEVKRRSTERSPCCC